LVRELDIAPKLLRGLPNLPLTVQSKCADFLSNCALNPFIRQTISEDKELMAVIEERKETDAAFQRTYQYYLSPGILLVYY
jgi:hypothetical protein